MSAASPGESPPYSSNGLSKIRNKVTIDEAIEEVGAGRTQYILLVVCGLTFCSDAAEVTFLSYVTEVLKCDWGITEAQESSIASIVFAGQAVGAMCWGTVGDKFGRRVVFLLSSAIICVFGLLTAACQNVEQLLVIRALVGFGIAGLPIAFDILAEALPTSARGRFLMNIEYFWTFGSVYVNIVAWLFLESAGWQFVTVLAAVPTLVATIAGYYLLPESPRWLVEVDKEAEALKIVNSWILRNGHDIKIASLSDDSHHEELGCSALWARRKLRYVFIVMGVVWFCVGMSYYGIVLLLPRVFEHGASEAADVQVGDVCSRGLAFDFKDLGVAVASEVVGVFLATLVIDKPGRTWTQFIFYAVAGACSFVLAFTNLDKNVLLVAGTLARLSCMAAFCATYVHTPELFPTRVRGTAHTSVNLSSRVGAFLAPWMISDLVPQFREDVLTGLLAMSVVAILAGVCAMLLPETSGKEMTDAEYDATDDEDEDDDDEEGSEDPLGPTAE